MIHNTDHYVKFILLIGKYQLFMMYKSLYSDFWNISGLLNVIPCYVMLAVIISPSHVYAYIIHTHAQYIYVHVINDDDVSCTSNYLVSVK